MQLGLEQGLSSLVKAKYTEAKTSQAIVFSETELTTIKTRSGVPVSDTIQHNDMERLLTL